MYLVSNKNINCGDKVKKQDIKNSIFFNLKLKDCYYEKLVESYSCKYSVSPLIGSVDCDLIDDYDYVLDFYEYIYEVIEVDGYMVVKKRYNDNEYISLVLDLILLSKNKKGRLYSIVELLNHKVIQDDGLDSIIVKIKRVMESVSHEDYGLVCLLKTLNDMIPVTYIKRDDFMKFLSGYFIENISVVPLITDEEKLFLSDFLNKFSAKKCSEEILKGLEVIELPF